MSVLPSPAAEQSASIDLLSVLRQSLEEGTQPPAAVLHATTEVARVLAGADGVALALRTKGLVVCRARSGDPTPELGAPLNTSSGISGECMRAASIMLCHDTDNDPRVDPEVCRMMGIRSIVVVPLRGPTGVAGILEAFSTRPNTFGEGQINSLRGLAEIAEAAYQREYRIQQDAALASLRSSRIRTPFAVATVTGGIEEKQVFDEPSLSRRYWVLGAASVAALLVAGVWLGGRESSPEKASAQPSAKTQAATTLSPTPTQQSVTAPKPQAGITRSHATADGVLKNAAEIESTEEPADVAINLPPASPTTARMSTPVTDPNPEPPSITIGSSTVAFLSGGPIEKLAAGTDALPTLDAKISEGVKEGKLIRRVDPAYPAQARAQRLAGNVAVQITIAEDGTIRDVKQISGSPVLAAAAGNAVRSWRYTPFLLNGKPVAIQKQITFVFKLP